MGQTLYNMGGKRNYTWWDCVKNDMEVYACPKRMLSSGINGERELGGNWLTQAHLENGR